MEQFRKLKDIENMEESYNKMVNAWGEYLERVKYAAFHPYTNIMRKYVLAPLYEYFSNEDNKDEILRKYPDYPFNFPDPYAEKEI